MEGESVISISATSHVLDAMARYNQEKKTLESLEQNIFHDDVDSVAVSERYVRKDPEEVSVCLRTPPRPWKKKKKSADYFSIKFHEPESIIALVESQDIEEFESPRKSNRVEFHPNSEVSATFHPNSEVSAIFHSPLRFAEEEVIEEFDSPRKGENRVDLLPNTEQFLDEWTVVRGKRRKRRCLGDQFKAIVDPYDSSVRRFAQDYRLKKFDEEQSMTLVIRYICGREDKLVWTISHHVEAGNDRCVMFKPFYQQEIAVGVVLKLYQPWKELQLPGLPLPVIFCADFYRTPQKRDNFFGVSEELRQELQMNLVPSKSSYINVIIDNDLLSTLSSLVPYHLQNPNTLANQTKLFKPVINLDAVIHQVPAPQPSKFCKILNILGDSDNQFCLLQPPVTTKGKTNQLFQLLKPGQYIKLRNLGIVSKTKITEDNRLFPMFGLLESTQRVYYTLNVRQDTDWEIEVYLDIPYRPIDLRTFQSTSRGNKVRSLQ